ncbi:MAG: hypothetical protein WCB99_05560 [Candidatus Cybelea sp.]|jgi:hypothetical protein
MPSISREFCKLFDIANPPTIFDNTTAYVTRYDPKFKAEWRTGTAILWDVLFSDVIGGNFDPTVPNARINITAASRASFGSEGFVSYEGSDTPNLKVSDLRIGRVVYGPTPIATSFAQKYVSSVHHGDFTLNSITLVNMTYETPDGWVNEVNLPAANGAPAYNLFTSPYYQASLEQQQTEYPLDGSWGPSIEPGDTPDAPYKGTNPIGWNNARLASRDRKGHWSKWELLSKRHANAECQTSTFRVVASQPYSFAVLIS